MAGCWASGLPEAREDTAFGRRHHGVGGTLAWYSLVHNERAAAAKVSTVGRNSLSNEGSYGTCFSTVAPAKPHVGCLGYSHKAYEMFDDFNYTDECAPASPARMNISLTRDQHEPDNLAVRFEATDQSDVSGCRQHGGEDSLLAETETTATIFPESEVSPCTATPPV